MLGKKRLGLKSCASGPQIEVEECVMPDGSWMMAGDWREYEGCEGVESVAGVTTLRTEVAAPTRRSVSWKVERRSGQWDWKSVVSITAYSSPVSEEGRRSTMFSTSLRISESREGSDRMYDSCQKDVATVFVVAKNNVEISKFAMSRVLKPHF